MNRRFTFLHFFILFLKPSLILHYHCSFSKVCSVSTTQYTQCTLHSVNSVHCTVYTVHCTQCTLHHIRYKVHRVSSSRRAGLYYWALPDKVLGNRVSAYGGNLTVYQRYGRETLPCPSSSSSSPCCPPPPPPPPPGSSSPGLPMCRTLISSW